jgi:xanthine dehydrogenase accessory factor
MLVMIKGAGEIASVTAITLQQAGYRVVMVEDPAPAEARRGMAFTEAVYSGSAALEGVRAERVELLDAPVIAGTGVVPVVVAADARVAAAMLKPDVLVDARMNKRVAPEPQIGQAPLVIALGPGVRVGVTADLAIETNRGPNEGAVLTSGETDANTGVVVPEHLPEGGGPRHAYAPAAGTWETAFGIGDPVESGTVLGRVAGLDVTAPVAGLLRGITRSGAMVAEGTRVADVDPWRAPERARGITRHSQTIADGVLRAIREHARHGEE